MDISNRIKKLRHHLNLSQTEFGERLGSSYGAVGMWEQGRRSVSESMIILISLRYKVDENWLRTGKGEMFLKTSEDNLLGLKNHYNLSEEETRIIKNFLNLEDKKRRDFIKTFKSLVE